MAEKCLTTEIALIGRTLHGKLPKVFHTKTEGQRNSQGKRGNIHTTEAQSNTDISPMTVPTKAKFTSTYSSTATSQITMV